MAAVAGPAPAVRRHLPGTWAVGYTFAACSIEAGSKKSWQGVHLAAGLTSRQMQEDVGRSGSTSPWSFRRGRSGSRSWKTAAGSQPGECSRVKQMAKGRKGGNRLSAGAAPAPYQPNAGGDEAGACERGVPRTLDLEEELGLVIQSNQLQGLKRRGGIPARCTYR